MAPKRKQPAEAAPPVLQPEQQAELERSKELVDKAMLSGVLSKTRRMDITPLPLPPMLLKADGKDVTKKSTTRRGRYLLNICAKLAPAAAGRLGTLAALNSRNPVLYIDFPEGRLKFFGTLTFPRNRYMVLRFGNKDVVCEDVLENMIVFAEAWWIGTAEGNPAEEELPLPDSLKSTVRHKDFNFEGGGDASMPTGKRRLSTPGIGLPASSQPEAPRSSRQRSKRKRYAESESEAGSSSDDSGRASPALDDESEEERPLRHRSRRRSSAGGKGRTSTGAAAARAETASQEPSSGAAPALAPSRHRLRRRPPVKQESDTDERTNDDPIENSGDEGNTGRRPRRQAAPRQSLLVSSDEEAQAADESGSAE